VIHHAHAVLQVKAADGATRRISGIATTPATDRTGDSVDPLGATFTNPIPLLWHHDTQRPIGLATLSAPTHDGIRFEAKLPTITEPGPLRDRVDEAWQSIKAGLITGVSVGYRVLDGGLQILKTGGRRFTQTEICEVSLVTVPANMHATIDVIKSLDAAFLAASGPGPSGVPEPPTVYARRKSAPVMTAQEKIQNFENTRAAKVAQIAAIMESAPDGTTLPDDKRESVDDLTLEVKAIDGDLVRYRELDKLQAASATRIVPAVGVVPQRNPVVSIKSNVPPGTAFVRAACAKLVCNGNLHEAAEYAKRWDATTPEVSLYLKAAIAPGTVTDATWAGPLVNPNIANEFIELLRPATILGKIPGLRTVPFNTKVPAQTAGGTYGWVGESKPKPVTKLAFAATTLGIAKAAGIIVLTEELVRLSNPSAEDLVRRDMVAGIAQFLDAQFIDPAVAAVAGVNPASITNGAPTAAGSASPLADIVALINHFATNNIGVDGVTFILSAANCLALSFRTNQDGSPMFPGITIGGGNYKGLTFIASQAAGANVIALQPALVLYADDGGVTIDASREASLQMDSAPASPADATTVYVSLWQTNCVGLRAERYVNWLRANTNAVKYLTAVAWPAPSGAMAEDVPHAKSR
jgi:HK97 family phage major capsid protein/HK97 family phage prohead protease